MKKLFTFALGVISGAVAMFGAREPERITSVEPPFWWTGMASDTLQLMLSGPGIAAADFSLEYPGVNIDSQVRLDSDNYKFLYLTVSPDACPGRLEFGYTLGGRKGRLAYELKPRDRRPEDYKGFSSEDVLYLLMPDRFARGLPESGDAERQKSLRNKSANDRSNPNARHGGDMLGVERHLGYLDSLGVTAIWLCPVLENDMPDGSYHGYATTDYYRIDPRFGTNDDWRRLVGKAHDRNMKVVMDMIFNHSGSSHPWMADMPSRDGYNHPKGDVLTNFRLSTVHDPYVSDYDLDHTVNGWFVPAMPDLNQRNPHLMRYLIQNSIWWIESSKIDGIRMDTYPYADARAMAEWNKALLREYPEFNIVGECWYANEAGSAFWQRGNRLNGENSELPTVMDFWFILNGREAFSAQTDPWNGLNKVYDHLSNDYLYPDPQRILTFLDNHDTDRFLASLPEDLGIWKQAQTFLLTSRGIPQIYYGTELLMNGSKEGSDGFVRRDFPGGFPGDKTDAFTPEGRTPLQNEAWNFMSKLLNWRRGEANDVIAHGSLKHFMPQNGLYVYQRRLGDKAVTVILNGNDAPREVTMERTVEILPYGTSLRDIISGENVIVEKEMKFAPRQVMILQNF